MLVRNQHPYARQQESLTAALGGQVQALLLNYEEELTSEFGVESSLATRLRFPVFIGSFTSEGEQTLRRMRRRLPAALRTFVAQYSAGLDSATSSDPRYELRLRVLQEFSPKDPDALAVQYTRYDDLTVEQRNTIEQIGRKGYVVVREQKRDVVGHGLLKLNQVTTAVAAEIPYTFTMGHFPKAWKALEVRPPTDADRPERTDARYCFYDERHNDYGYTDAYVRKLVRECRTAAGFRRLLGTAPKDKKRVRGLASHPRRARVSSTLFIELTAARIGRERRLLCPLSCNSSEQLGVLDLPHRSVVGGFTIEPSR